MATDLTQEIFEIADALDIEIRRDRTSLGSPLSGTASFSLDLLEGLDFQCPVRIVNSGVYPITQVLGVVVHICGSLYFVVLVGRAADAYTQLWVVDGAKLGWKPTDKFKVFCTSWARREFYASFVDGVVAKYTRKLGAANWDEEPHARRHIEEYLQENLARTPENTGMTFTHGSMAVTPTYRTNGPRDL